MNFVFSRKCLFGGLGFSLTSCLERISRIFFVILWRDEKQFLFLETKYSVVESFKPINFDYANFNVGQSQRKLWELWRNMKEYFENYCRHSESRKRLFGTVLER